MSSRHRLAMLILAVAALSAFPACVHNSDQTEKAQYKENKKDAQPGTGEKKEDPPDQTAFFSIFKIKETEKRLGALEQFIIDFPDSAYTASAMREIFGETIKIWPDDKDKMTDAANKFIRSPAKAGVNILDVSSDYQFIANTLFAAGIFLDEAEEYALKSIECFDKEQFIKNQKKRYEEKKWQEPSDEEMNRRYSTALAANRTTLGRIYLEKGKIAEGESCRR